MDPRGIANTIEAELRAAGTPERAEHERAYLKSDLVFLGASVPSTRRTVKGRAAEFAEASHDELRALVAVLWDEPQEAPIYERRLAAVEILDLCSARLHHDDFELIERFLRSAQTWALVDGIAVNVVGAMARRVSAAGDLVVGATLDRWIGDGDFWVRRSALLALLGPIRMGGGDTERFFHYADSQLDDREFFIRKAIGWVLREMSKRRPELVIAWLAPRTGRASGVTMREAVKHLDPSVRAALMTGYRARRATLLDA